MPQGKTALEAIVRQLGTLAGDGKPVAILWDMDGTLVDTRPRMLASVHAYGRTDVKLTDVSPSWQETARRLGLDHGRFQAVWQRVFWAYESFDADIENEDVAALARMAESLGVQTIIVTGRIEELRPVTDRQLKRLGLRPTRVFLKSEMGDCTPSVKAEVISQLAREGLRMGAFVTDSPEEIQAVTPEILENAPDLSCIFVQLEGTAPALREGVHRFTVPFRNGSRMAEVPRHLAVGEGTMGFGFEAEYEIAAADALLQLYHPEPASGISESDWHHWSASRRADWVFAQFPEPHSEEFDLPLRRNQRAPELDFLPAGLFVDSDGHIEVVSAPTDDLASMWNQIERLEHVCGPPLLQVTISVPSHSILGDPSSLAALDGYLSFHHFLDTLERMDVGHVHYLENPERDVLLPFFHPWLGPMTGGKHRFMRQYLEANARGHRLDEKWVRLVDRAFSSFKYINGSAYRPALAGPDRIAIEIRDAHRNKALLAQRVSRHATSLLSGLEPYACFSVTWAFDSETDYERIPAEVRRMLETVISTRERPEIDHMYSDYDRVALQVYRNFALPLKDYSDVEVALGDKPGAQELLEAQLSYQSRLLRLARDLETKGSERVRREVQGALVCFADESGLLARLRAFSQKCLSRPAAREAAARVHSFLPLMRAVPPTAWSGSLQKRLERLQKRWPKQVLWLPVVSFFTRSAEAIQRPLLLLSVHGLSPGEVSRLRADYLHAVASGTLGVRATDRGSLELRFGKNVYSPGTWANEESPYEPFSVGAGMESMLRLSGLESYCLGRQLAAHQPCDEAARRVSASGWLRHLSLGLQGEKLEDDLELPYPESIETAAQVLERVLGCASESRMACLVGWTERSPQEWLAEHREFGEVTLRSERSTLESGFPASLRSDAPLNVRLDEFVARWPRHSRLVEGVPFVFGQQSTPRSVLVLAMNGLSDDEFEHFRQDYLDSIGCDTISFPCRRRAEHLRTRIGHLALALSPEGVRVDFYAPPWQRRRMEAVVELEPKEMNRLRCYLGAVVDDTLGMLGPITLGSGCRTGVGRTDDNRPADGGMHNCTTWVTLAPVGEDGRDLATLVQMPDSWTSHDNPGWWSMFLTGASRSPRVHTVVYWTDLPLEREPCATGEMIPWDFNPH
jgi:phosphoglycolate phosphatase-like HAD superfamily hydrolase